MWEQPEKITDKDKIVEICRKYFNTNDFLYALHIKSQNLLVEGPGILSIAHGEKVNITLTNSDSGYTSPIGSVELDDIGYIQEKNF